jgi:hypothetical protein
MTMVNFDELIKRLKVELPPEILHDLRVGCRRVNEMEAELKKWNAKHPESDLQEMREQAKDDRNIATKQAYINALEFHLAHERQKVQFFEDSLKGLNHG